MYKGEIKNAQGIILNEKKLIIQGICPVCGIKLFGIGKA
jgi:hypothetical protein